MNAQTLIQLCKEHKALLQRIPSAEETDLSINLVNSIFYAFKDIYDYEGDEEFSKYVLKATTEEMLDKIIEKITQLETEKIARKFAWILLRDLGIDKMQDVNMVNSKRNDSSCATHDHCDSNEAMLEALEAYGYGYDPESDSITDIINESWSLAKKNNFYIQ
jgi:hypothetical protein